MADNIGPEEARAAATPADKRATINRQIATAGLMIATAMQAADSLIINVALPRLAQSFGGGIELATWVMTSYLCATAVTAPFTALLRRRYGARRLFPAAVAAFIAASLLCAAAPSGAALILFRVLQGAAGGVILPLAQAMLLDIYPARRHARMLGMLGAVVMLGPILGPLVGGIVTDLASWRAAFLVNLPLGLVAIVAVRLLSYEEEIQRKLPLDGVGMLLMMVAVGALQLCLERGVGRSWLNSPELLAEAAACVAASGAMLLRARHTGFSVFRSAVLRDVNFAVAAFYNFMMSGMLFVTLVFVPIIGEELFGFTATLAGFTIVPRALLMMLIMLAAGEMIGRVDYRILLGVGWLTMCGGLGLLSQLPPEGALLWLIIGSTVQAAGAGLLMTTQSTLAYSTLAPALRTDASGLFSLLRQLGFASGVALMTAVLRLEIARHSGAAAVNGARPPSVDLAALLGYRACFRMMAVASLIIIPGIFLFRAAPAAARRAGSATPAD